MTANEHSLHERPFPDRALVVIQPSKSTTLDFAELWQYRELLYFLTWRDVKVRYKQTALGAAWAILQPLFMMGIFTLFFGRLAGFDTGGVPYPLFALAGLVPWTFFANAISMSGNSMVGSTHLISKVYFPRILIPAGAIAACLVDLGLSAVVLAAALALYHVAPTTHLLMLPFLVLLTSTLAFGVGAWLSALNVKYRDVRFLLPFLIQLWFFASCVIVPSNALPAKWRGFIMLNPMTGVIEAYRSSLFGLPFHWASLGFATVVTIGVLIYSTYAFRRMEKHFADMI
jgi:lipopolysaccharide transport system permease protein